MKNFAQHKIYKLFFCFIFIYLHKIKNDYFIIKLITNFAQNNPCLHVENISINTGGH